MMTLMLRLAPILVLVAMGIACLFPLLALVTRFDWIGYQTALPLLAGTTLTAVLVLAMMGIILLLAIRKSIPAVKNRTALAMIVLLVPLSVVLYFGLKVSRYPMIHNIATDTANPPVFHKLQQMRPDGANPLEQSEETIRLQKSSYSDITSLVVKGSVTGVLKHAQKTAQKLGWDVVYTDVENGHLEAKSTTFWFGFTDDIVVRIKSVDTDIVVDLQSVSRVGVSDLGKNADRIRLFQSVLKSSL